ncbi:hypothetical protein HY837_06515 [archaeon]|nr:hypothetical protein [archaeon]
MAKNRSKGVTAFGWYFTVLSVLVFYSNLSFLISELLKLIRLPPNVFGIFSMYMPVIRLSFLDYLIAIVGLLVAGRLFLIAVDILNSKLRSLNDLNFSAYSFVAYYLLIIIESIREVWAGTGFFSEYGLTSAIMNIIFWFFVMKFFEERKNSL